MNIGNEFLIASAIVSGLAVLAFFVGGIIKSRAALFCARALAVVAAGLVTAAVAYMLYLLLNHNFAFEYVAEYSARALSPLYLVSALWGGNQGTWLLWVWLLAVAGALMIITSRARDRAHAPYAAGIFLVVQTFMLALVLYVHPFARMGVIPADGLGQTPFFNSIGMLLHAPVLMAGYAGLIVAFALAMAALLAGRTGNDWLQTARRWALFSWLLVGAGILLGAWSGYTALGEGSFWHWDPVENASLMPWLATTAFLHSVTMQNKRGVFKVWSMLLIILTFGLVIFSTLLNRTNIISAIHTSVDAALAYTLMAFLVAMMFLSCALVFLRQRGLAGQAQIESAVSKEGTFLLTNLLFVAATLGILLGTIDRLLNNYAVSLNASLAAPFFNRVGIPLFLLIILLMGVCITLGWRRVALRRAARTLLWPVAACLLIGLALFIFLSQSWYAAAGIAVCCLVPITAVTEWVKSTAARHRTRGENYLKAFVGLIWNDKPRHSGYIIHIALILIAIGVIGSSASGVSKEASLLPGESVEVGGYSVTYDKLSYDPTPGRMVFTADISVYKHDKLIAELTPKTYFDRSFNGEVNTPAIRSTPASDIYVTVVGWNDTGLTEFKVRVIPMMMWVWIGGWLMALGGLIAFWPQKKAEAADAAAEELEPGSAA